VHLALLTFELHVPGAQSLKDKRRVVRSVKDKLHREHQVCVAEVAFHDRLAVAGMAIALVNADASFCRRVLDVIEAKLRELPDGRLGACVREVLPASALPTAFIGEDGEPLWDERDRREDGQ
jgi:uncharacterized protein YlxP (DUF503 family)